MSSRQAISVVMSAYRNGAGLCATVQSVFHQLEEPENARLELEVIVVDDGADQSVQDALSDLQQQFPSLVVIHQDNRGLTRSLITACQQTQYDYIARIDVGDVMLAGRLAKQWEYLHSKPQVVAVASWANIVTEEGYPLYQIQHRDVDIMASLQPANPSSKILKDFVSPQHYTMMFRKPSYVSAGGYQAEFYFAQDVDLWLRLSELGQIGVIEEVLTQSVFSKNSLSSAYHKTQQRLSSLAWQAAVLRRQGDSEEAVLQQAKLIRPVPTQLLTRSHHARSFYFIAKCLLKHRHVAARQYFIRALKQQPLSIKSWVGLLQSLVTKQRFSP